MCACYIWQERTYIIYITHYIKNGMPVCGGTLRNIDAKQSVTRVSRYSAIVGGDVGECIQKKCTLRQNEDMYQRAEVNKKGDCLGLYK